ncbi:LytTR family DNA-binding domain-containing protein [Faecalicatena orotica]|uniref:Stage 0 sporulation protein A homolog n=1 Tax=Faecalicatena orotica TaxID=1544 RepID=A0A2Y9C6I7_9FIRM|nr:LytTR family DNA-binding domain-containing protein [Faecalicatena orotica]PWJ22551.1 LytTR family two component transcriptional regulator [Faecalicatena orotica]SSA58220.1 two component transcriptional regulator, LytTR family [Faecalicatena orotica]
MIRIAIVEDDKNSVDMLEDYIGRYQKEKKRKITTEYFRDGLEFISEYKACYDLILMDIEMPHLNGLDAARKLRMMDMHVCLIFITNMAQYAINGYEVQALDFMVKPVGYFNFSLKLDKVIRICDRQQSKYIFIPADEGNMKLDVDEILYIESYKHYLFLHTERGEFKIRSTMSDFMEKLPEDRFSCCSKSYCVNMGCITCFRSEFVKVNDVELRISRTYKKSFLDKMTTYINRGGY